MIHEILANRTVSAFPISVGTSLALESIFEASGPSIDPERIIPQKVNITDYTEFWLNISTLFRNIFGSLTREDSLRVSPGELADVLESEVEIIQFLTSQQSSNVTKPIFYVSNYQGIKETYPHALIRTDNTENQRRYRAIHNDTIKQFLKINDGSEAIRVFRRDIEATGKPKGLMMTHMAYDLLGEKSFRSLDLIESHTGILKSNALWYTKYNDGKNLPPMPFNSGLLQIFGDKETFGIPNIKLKRAIVELAKESKWTPVTSRDKIIFDLDKLKDSSLTTIALEMIRS